MDFEDFFAASYDRVRRTLALVCGDIAAAEDAAQEAFARAYRRWRRIRTMDRPDGWVYVVAVNVLRRRRRGRIDALHAEPTTVPSQSEDGIDLRSALLALPQRQREAVVLRFLGDMSVEQVADAMRCSPGTVKSTVHAALANLRVQLKEVPHGS